MVLLYVVCMVLLCVVCSPTQTQDSSKYEDEQDKKNQLRVSLAERERSRERARQRAREEVGKLKPPTIRL